MTQTETKNMIVKYTYVGCVPVGYWEDFPDDQKDSRKEIEAIAHDCADAIFYSRPVALQQSRWYYACSFLESATAMVQAVLFSDPRIQMADESPQGAVIEHRYMPSFSENRECMLVGGGLLSKEMYFTTLDTQGKAAGWGSFHLTSEYDGMGDAYIFGAKATWVLGEEAKLFSKQVYMPWDHAELAPKCAKQYLGFLVTNLKAVLQPGVGSGA